MKEKQSSDSGANCPRSQSKSGQRQNNLCKQMEEIVYHYVGKNEGMVLLISGFPNG